MTEPRTIAVIGSNAFSGADFIDLLLADPAHRVLAISRSPEKSPVFLAYRRRPAAAVTFHRIDLNQDLPRLLALLDAERPAAVVNFAAQSEVAPSWEHPDHWYRTNVLALAALAQALARRDYLRRYVQISSPEVYGTCEGVVTEDAPLNPSTPYAASKAAGDLALLPLVKQFDFPLVTIRATNVYGAGQQLWKIIPRTVIYLKLGRTIPLHGGGRAVKSYIHIRDVSRGEQAALERGRPGAVYHLSPDRGVAVRDVVRLICERMGKAFDACTETVAERPGQDKAYVIDSSRAREEFGWAPTVSLEAGIDETVRWVEDHWDAIQRESLEYVHRA